MLETLECARPSRAESADDPPHGFYRDLVSSMRNGMLAIDRSGRVAVINDPARRTLGVEPGLPAIGRPYGDVLGWGHQFCEVLASAFEMSHLPNRSELRLQGSGKMVGYTLSRIVDDQGSVTGAVVYFKDLTRVEQLEERERLRDRLAAIGEMAAAIAHEVKNPLAGIQVMAGLLKRRLPKGDDDQVVLNDIINEAQIANKIVVDLLEFVRPINVQVEPVSIDALVRDTLSKQRGQGRGQGIVVDARLPVGLPGVPGDETLLRQLLTNLLINAYEALDGYGRVTITARFEPVDESATVPGEPVEERGRVVLEVTDDGPGIPEDVTEKIFSPFFTTKPRGSGLGLAIVRKIVDAHDGGIDVLARPEGGTCFRVTLPVRVEADEPDVTASAPERQDALVSSTAG